MKVIRVLADVTDEDIVTRDGEKILYIPDNVDEIGYGALVKLSQKVDLVYVPNSIKFIHNGAFVGLEAKKIIFGGCLREPGAPSQTMKNCTIIEMNRSQSPFDECKVGTIIVQRNEDVDLLHKLYNHRSPRVGQILTKETYKRLTTKEELPHADNGRGGK